MYLFGNGVWSHKLCVELWILDFIVVSKLSSQFSSTKSIERVLAPTGSRAAAVNT